jgi:hypothetical protein
LFAAIALYLGVAFTVVPMTKGYALAAIDYVLEPIRTLWQGFLGSVGDVIFIVVVVILARYLIKGPVGFGSSDRPPGDSQCVARPRCSIQVPDQRGGWLRWSSAGHRARIPRR